MGTLRLGNDPQSLALPKVLPLLTFKKANVPFPEPVSVTQEEASESPVAAFSPQAGCRLRMPQALAGRETATSG